MRKQGTTGHPKRLRVQNESRMEDVVAICERNHWKFLGGIEPEHPVNISELEYMLHPKQFKGKRPIMKSTENTTIIKTGPSIGRNDLCPCGSWKKYKQCCLGV